MFNLMLSLVIVALAFTVSMAEPAVNDCKKGGLMTRRLSSSNPDVSKIAAETQTLGTTERANVPGAVLGKYASYVFNSAHPWDCAGSGDMMVTTEVDKVGACLEMTDAADQVAGYFKLDCWLDNQKTRLSTFDIADSTCSTPISERWMNPVTCSDGALAVCHADSSFMKTWEGIQVFAFFPTEADAKANYLDTVLTVVSGSKLNVIRNFDEADRKECNDQLLRSGECVDTRKAKSRVNFAHGFDEQVLILYDDLDGQGPATTVEENPPGYYVTGTQVQTHRFLVSNWYNEYWAGNSTQL